MINFNFDSYLYKMPYNENIINKVDRVTLFWYIIIFILVLFIFSKMKIELNILVGIIVALGILFVLYSNYYFVQSNTDELFKQKINLIYPPPKKTINRPELINFLFSIQDLYIYNPQAYEDMREYISNFLFIYDETVNNKFSAEINYKLIKNQKINALNSLQSILLKMPPNSEYDMKLKYSTITLEKLLNEYMQDIYDIYERNLYENGYTTNTRIIETDPVGYNNESKDAYYDRYDLFQ